MIIIFIIITHSTFQLNLRLCKWLSFQNRFSVSGQSRGFVMDCWILTDVVVHGRAATTFERLWRWEVWGLISKMDVAPFPPTEDKWGCLVPEREYGNEKKNRRYQTKMRIKLLWRGLNWTVEMIRSAFFFSPHTFNPIIKTICAKAHAPKPFIYLPLLPLTKKSLFVSTLVAIDTCAVQTLMRCKTHGRGKKKRNKSVQRQFQTCWCF